MWWGQLLYTVPSEASNSCNITPETLYATPLVCWNRAGMLVGTVGSVTQLFSQQGIREQQRVRSHCVPGTCTKCAASQRQEGQLEPRGPNTTLDVIICEITPKASAHRASGSDPGGNSGLYRCCQQPCGCSRMEAGELLLPPQHELCPAAAAAASVAGAHP